MWFLLGKLLSGNRMGTMTYKNLPHDVIKTYTSGGTLKGQFYLRWDGRESFTYPLPYSLFFAAPPTFFFAEPLQVFGTSSPYFIFVADPSPADLSPSLCFHSTPSS